LLVAAACANNAPIANDDSATTTAGSPVTINVLDNDSDPDGDAISVTAVGSALHGTTQDNGDGTVTYTPNSGYAGSDVFGYTIGDGRGGTDTATVSVSTTSAGNRPPDAANDSATTVEDQPTSI